MLPSGTHLVRGFVRVLAATAVALTAVAIVSLVLQLRFAETAQQRGLVVALMVLTVVGAPAAAGLSLSLAWRNWHRGDARALATFLALAAWVLAGDGLWALLRLAGTPAWLARTVDLSIPVCVVAGMAAMLRFSCTFPRPLTPAELASPGASRAARVLSALQRWSTNAAGVRRAAVWLSVGAILVPQTVLIAASALGDAHAIPSVLKYGLLGLLLGSMTVSAANLRAGYRVADVEGRRRIFWVLEGFLLATAIALLASALKVLQDMTGYAPAVPFWYGMAMMAAFTALLGCVAVAMFYAGALDPALAIRRTAVVGLVGVMTVILFATLEQALQGWLGQRLGLSDRAGGVLTGVAVGLTFEPLRARSSALVDRVLARWSGASAPESASLAAVAVRTEPA
jgi:NADH:ubiquinone oxidoreductase subunit K